MQTFFFSALCPLPAVSWTLFPLCYGLCTAGIWGGGTGGALIHYHVMNGAAALCMFTPVQWKRIIPGLVERGYGGN